MNKIITTLALAACAAASLNAQPAGSFFTDRFGYDGSITRYDTLADAQAGTNPVDSKTITDRDFGIYVRNGYASSSDLNVFMGTWWYTIVENPTPDDTSVPGWGNSRGNSGAGFNQLFDIDGSTETALSMAFDNFDGTYWTEFDLSVSGVNATVADDSGRLWYDFQGSGADRGEYLEYALDVTAFGLEGVETSPGIIEATNHPTGVSGTFSGIFENQSTTYSQNNGFYVFEFTLDMDNWAWDNRDDLLATDVASAGFGDSYFAIVPEPSALVLLGLGGLALALIRRRR